MYEARGEKHGKRPSSRSRGTLNPSSLAVNLPPPSPARPHSPFSRNSREELTHRPARFKSPKTSSLENLPLDDEQSNAPVLPALVSRPYGTETSHRSRQTGLRPHSPNDGIIRDLASFKDVTSLKQHRSHSRSKSPMPSSEAEAPTLYTNTISLDLTRKSRPSSQIRMRRKKSGYSDSSESDYPAPPMEGTTYKAHLNSLLINSQPRSFSTPSSQY